MHDQPPTRGIATLFQNKLLTALLAVALVLGIVAEGITAYRGYIGIGTDLANRSKAEAEAHAVNQQPGKLTEGMCKAELKAYGGMSVDDIRLMTAEQIAELHKGKCP